jgi:hypothetical protein
MRTQAEAIVNDQPGLLVIARKHTAPIDYGSMKTLPNHEARVAVYI